MGKVLVRGIGASMGVVKGRVFVAFSVDDAIRKVGVVGDVLVAPMTDPTWTVVFPKVRAVVTDIGGLASHAAIVSRELGIPAVVGTGNATGVLRDGMCVVVDGGEGVVYACNGT